MEIGDQAPDLSFVISPGETKRLTDFGPGPWVLIFLRHLA